MSDEEPIFGKMSGDDLRISRERLYLTQAQVAAAIGTTQQTVDRIERGETKFSRYRLPLEQYLHEQFSAAFHESTSPSPSLTFRPTVPIYYWNNKDEPPVLTGQVTAPIPLGDAVDCYAVLLNYPVIGPRGDAVFSPGDTLFADPSRPVRHYTWAVARRAANPEAMDITIWVDPLHLPPTTTRQSLDDAGYAVKGDEGLTCHALTVHYIR